MWLADKWDDYELLDCSGGEKLERWGRHILVRPDPQAIWRTPKEHPGWESPDARYMRSKSGGGRWNAGGVQGSWRIGYRGSAFCGGPLPGGGLVSDGGKAPDDRPVCGRGPMPGGRQTYGSGTASDGGLVSDGELVFNVGLMNFKHTGLFPEQAVNWEYIAEKVRSAGRKVSVLNLFAYTGGATLAAAAAGADVCHVDAARGMVLRAKENVRASGLEDAPVRWIIDDCAKFVEREIRRGRRYDALIMDPPSFGRGPSGEVWKLEDGLYDFVKLCAGVLSDDPLFVLINSYTAGLSPSALSYIARSLLGGQAESREIGLPVKSSGLALPCGATCRWEPDPVSSEAAGGLPSEERHSG